MTIAVRVLGWRSFLLERPTDAAIAVLLVVPGPADGLDAMLRDWELPPSLLDALAGRTPAGVPNRLSSAHRSRDVIDGVAAATTKKTSPDAAFWHHGGAGRAPESRYGEQSARRIIRQRRSALAMDGRTVLRRNHF